MTIEVTQADRDSRRELLNWFIAALERGCSECDTPDDRNREMDLIFARHRIAAYEAGVLDGTMKAVREMRKDSNRPKTKEPLTCRGEASE